MKERLIQLFSRRYGRRPEAILEIAADGSTRQYFRLLRSEGNPVVGAIGPDHEENRAFLSFAKAFRGIGLPVPEIYDEDREAGVWLEEDLGDTTLFQALTSHRSAQDPDVFPAEALELLRRSLTVLPRFQVEGHEAVDYRLAYPRQAFDRRSIRWDLNYFKYHFLKLAHVEFNEQRLEDDFSRLTGLLLEADSDYFLYRDFQSRNIMIREGEPWFIDFQGGRKGALQYDVASLLYDAKANLPPSVREGLLDHYLGALSEVAPIEEESFRIHFKGFVLIRLMQAMGAFGYRGFFERKRRFLESVPFAAKNLGGLVESGLPTKLPELEGVFNRIVERWAREESGDQVPSRLTVSVQSFSFKRGYPEDSSGHGGGHVFDCRGLPNPGRLDEYVDLTGQDEPVIDFLERSPLVQEFWEAVKGIAEMHVESYLDRGFTDLAFSFGCTGGQHRSVFMARKLADHLRVRFPNVQSHLSHREL
jgi:aminoglycoside/choline kinase family phosphotransferase